MSGNTHHQYRFWYSFLTAKSAPMLSAAMNKSVFDPTLPIIKSFHYRRSIAYGVVLCKSNVYYSLQKILKSTNQNLQHGTIL
jgi:hypothetical protein